MHYVDVLRRAATIAALAMVSMAPSAALAASGTALGVDPQAEAQTSGISRVLTVGADVEIGDTVRTGEKGQVQIKFSDSTELVVGPNSVLTLEDYLLRGDQSAGKLAINALAGTFRFATGVAQKDRYLITTPTGTIGVRGTEFDFNVDDEGTHVLLFHGAVRLCNLNNVCVTLDGTCEIGEYDTTDSQIIGPASETTGEAREAWKDQFEYAQSQAPLLREFWFETARQCFNQGFEGNDTDSLLTGGSSDDGGGCPEYPGDYGFRDDALPEPEFGLDLLGDGPYSLLPAVYDYNSQYYDGPSYPEDDCYGGDY